MRRTLGQIGQPPANDRSTSASVSGITDVFGHYNRAGFLETQHSRKDEATWPGVKKIVSVVCQVDGSTVTTVNEGDDLVFVITTEKFLGTETLYYSTDAVAGTMDSSDWKDESATGSFTVTSPTTNVTKTLLADAPGSSAENDTFQFKVRETSVSGPVLASTATITITDVIAVNQWQANNSSTTVWDHTESVKPEQIPFCCGITSGAGGQCWSHAFSEGHMEDAFNCSPGDVIKGIRYKLVDSLEGHTGTGSEDLAWPWPHWNIYATNGVSDSGPTFTDRWHYQNAGQITSSSNTIWTNSISGIGWTLVWGTDTTDSPVPNYHNQYTWAGVPIGSYDVPPMGDVTEDMAGTDGEYCEFEWDTEIEYTGGDFFIRVIAGNGTRAGDGTIYPTVDHDAHTGGRSGSGYMSFNWHDDFKEDQSSPFPNVENWIKTPIYEIKNPGGSWNTPYIGDETNTMLQSAYRSRTLIAYGANPKGSGNGYFPAWAHVGVQTSSFYQDSSASPTIYYAPVVDLLIGD